MKTIRLFTAALAVATIGLVGCDTDTPTAATGASPLGKTTQRSIQEFVDAQGTFCFPDGVGGCIQFVAPVDNYIGWGSPSQDRSVSMDYAGIANRYIKSASGGAKDLKTSFSGTVTERTLDDGRALVSIDLKTKDALTYVVAPQHQYASGTLLLGHRAPDVVAGATPALADCQLKVDVVLARPGDPLPDLLQILAFPATGQEVRRMTFEGTGRGALHAAYGVPEGTAGKVQVTQIGAWNAKSHSPNWDGFPAEHVNISVGK